MRILLKILLFPVVLVLTVLVAFCRFVCLFSGMILGIVAVLLFLIGIVAVMFYATAISDTVGESDLRREGNALIHSLQSVLPPES